MTVEMKPAPDFSHLKTLEPSPRDNSLAAATKQEYMEDRVMIQSAPIGQYQKDEMYWSAGYIAVEGRQKKKVHIQNWDPDEWEDPKNFSGKTYLLAEDGTIEIRHSGPGFLDELTTFKVGDPHFPLIREHRGHMTEIEKSEDPATHTSTRTFSYTKHTICVSHNGTTAESKEDITDRLTLASSPGMLEDMQAILAKYLNRMPTGSQPSE